MPGGHVVSGGRIIIRSAVDPVCNDADQGNPTGAIANTMTGELTGFVGEATVAVLLSGLMCYQITFRGTIFMPTDFCEC